VEKTAQAFYTDPNLDVDPFVINFVPPIFSLIHGGGEREKMAIPIHN
jgi:hypothetical protein